MTGPGWKWLMPCHQVFDTSQPRLLSDPRPCQCSPITCWLASRARRARALRALGARQHVIRLLWMLHAVTSVVPPSRQLTMATHRPTPWPGPPLHAETCGSFFGEHPVLHALTTNSLQCCVYWTSGVLHTAIGTESNHAGPSRRASHAPGACATKKFP